MIYKSDFRALLVFSLRPITGMHLSGNYQNGSQNTIDGGRLNEDWYGSGNREQYRSVVANCIGPMTWYTDKIYMMMSHEGYFGNWEKLDISTDYSWYWCK